MNLPDQSENKSPNSKQDELSQPLLPNDGSKKKTPKIEPSFTWKFVGLTILISLITTLITVPFQSITKAKIEPLLDSETNKRSLDVTLNTSWINKTNREAVFIIKNKGKLPVADLFYSHRFGDSTLLRGNEKPSVSVIMPGDSVSRYYTSLTLQNDHYDGMELQVYYSYRVLGLKHYASQTFHFQNVDFGESERHYICSNTESEDREITPSENWKAYEMDAKLDDQASGMFTLHADVLRINSNVPTCYLKTKTKALLYMDRTFTFQCSFTNRPDALYAINIGDDTNQWHFLCVGWNPTSVLFSIDVKNFDWLPIPPTYDEIAKYSNNAPTNFNWMQQMRGQ